MIWAKLLADETLIGLCFDISLQTRPGSVRMYRSQYNSQTELLSVSLTEGLESASESEDEGWRYLTRVLGEELSTILTQCATIQPEDPILFLASELQR